MERKKFLIVTAGGMGTRMGGSVPKQFLELDGKPILRLTIERFLQAEPDLQVITVLPQAHVSTWRQYCIKADFTCPQRLVKGGFTRFHSVQNAGLWFCTHSDIVVRTAAGDCDDAFTLIIHHPDGSIFTPDAFLQDLQ